MAFLRLKFAILYGVFEAQIRHTVWRFQAPNSPYGMAFSRPKSASGGLLACATEVVRNPKHVILAHLAIKATSGCKYDDELFAAAEDAHRADEVLSILKTNLELIRIADPAGDTVLHVAARAGNLEAVKKLIAFLDCYGYSKLLYKVLADENGDGDTTLLVIRNNRDWEVAKEAEIGIIQGITLQSGLKKEIYILQSYEEMAEVRLDLMKGVPIKVAERWNHLYLKINKGQAIPDVIMTWLKENGNELLWHRNEQTGETLLDAAVNNELKYCLEPVEHLVKFMVNNSLTDAALLRNKAGDTALHLALRCGHFSKALLLVKAIPEAVYQPNFKGVSPLYLAVKVGHNLLVEDMFEVMSQSSDPTFATKLLSMPNNKHATLAHCAIKHGCIEILQMVIAHLPQLMNETDRKGWRPLSYAANQGYLDEFTFLLVKFPQYATKFDRDGTYPIHKAVAGGHVSIVQAFLKYCPEALQLVDRKGRSVLHIAVRYGKHDVLIYIKENIKMDEALLTLRDSEGKTFKDYAEQMP